MSTPLAASPAASDDRTALRRVWWLVFSLGLLSMVVGVAALASPHLMTEATVTVFGVLLMIQGVGEAGHAMVVRNWRGFALHLLAAALYLFAGLFILEDRTRAAGVLTQLLGAVYLVGGVVRVLFAVAGRFPAWKWVAVTGVIDLLLGVIVLSAGPEAGLWLIGTLVGVDLLFHGWSLVALALAVRSATTPAATA